MDRLKDNVIIVTGGAQGIGLAYCLALAKEGARVVVADIDQGALKRRFNLWEKTAPTPWR